MSACGTQLTRARDGCARAPGVLQTMEVCVYSKYERELNERARREKQLSYLRRAVYVGLFLKEGVKSCRMMRL